ncbi:NUMOD4 domain-containing protein [Novosphingobium sp. ZW T3_23]|uniref:NUMOD4 domain-containing protein n=1 Tax=Novosphingobium sp. ZW T3_23 TaxID=3378084 RepID=UPI003852116F
MSKPEEWRPVLGYEGYYEVSSRGRVRSISRTRQARRRNGTDFTMRMAGRELVVCLNKDGYLQGNMCVDRVRKNFEVHRLVCEAFHGPAPEGHEAAHNDGVRTNCDESNLRWATPAENTADRDKHGTMRRGEDHPGAKLTIHDVRRIRSSQQSGPSLARQFGVCRSVITKIRSRKIWKSVA